MTEGIHFEAFPATLALPAESGSFPFMLLGTPQTAGTLVIKGILFNLSRDMSFFNFDHIFTPQIQFCIMQMLHGRAETCYILARLPPFV